MTSTEESSTKKLETHLNQAQEFLQKGDPLEAVKQLFFAGFVMAKSTEFGEELESKSLELQKIVQSISKNNSNAASQDIERIKEKLVTTNNDTNNTKS